MPATTKIVRGSKPRKNKTYPVDIRITYERKSVFLSTGIFIGEKDLDTSGKVKKQCKYYKDIQHVNKYIKEKREDVDDFIIESIPVEHNNESLAYRLTNRNGISVVYSGDTDFSNNLVTLAKEADLLICESAFPDKLKGKGHLTPSLAGKIATMANVRKLLLTHFYPECHEVDIKRECRGSYNNELIIAEDLMTINVM